MQCQMYMYLAFTVHYVAACLASAVHAATILTNNNFVLTVSQHHFYCFLIIIFLHCIVLAEAHFAVLHFVLWS